MMGRSQSGTGLTRQEKLISLGFVFISWGIVGAVWSYLSDTNSLDILRMMSASENAIFHAVLWCAIGAGFLLAGLGYSSSWDDDDGQGWQRGD